MKFANLTETGYRQLRARHIQRLRAQGVPAAEELVDEALFRALEKDEDIHSFDAYVGTILRFVCFEDLRRRYRERGVGMAAEAMPAASGASQEGEMEFDRHLEFCKRQLPRSERLLWDEYHGGPRTNRIERRKKLAIRLGISQENLRQRIHRIADRLRRCAEQRAREAGLS